MVVAMVNPPSLATPATLSLWDTVNLLNRHSLKKKTAATSPLSLLVATLNRDPLNNSRLNLLNPNRLNRLRNHSNLSTHSTRDLRRRLLRKHHLKNNFNLNTRSIAVRLLPHKHHLLLKLPLLPRFPLPHKHHLSCNHRYRLTLRDPVAVPNPVTGR